MAKTTATSAKATKSTTKSAKPAAAKGSKAAAVTPTTVRRPKMHPETKAQLEKGKTLTVEVAAGASFDTISKELNRRLVIDPGIINPKGCAPCHSGLDMVIIKNKAINVIR
jgi:hypothetical protein